MTVQLEDNIYATLILIVLMISESSSRGSFYSDYDYDFVTQHHFDIDWDIRSDIKRALYFDGNNRDLDRFITNTFNLRNSNPIYVFVLPDKKQRRLVMRRRDFRKPTFPNVTQTYISLSRMQSKKHFEQGKNDFDTSASDPSSTIWELESATADENDAVLENVRTERTFIEYMNDLNRKGEVLTHAFQKTEKIQARISGTVTKPLKKSHRFHRKRKSDGLSAKGNTSDWEELGLVGWTGHLSRPDHLEKLKENDKTHKEDLRGISVALENPIVVQRTAKLINHGDTLTPLQFNFLDDPDNAVQWDLPGKVANDFVPIFNENSATYLNLSKIFNATTSPKWPVTSSRSAHRNKDVFIARANDPFGYSTKWSLRNASNDAVMRKKRGVGELYSMLKCSTGCDPLIFKGYGCYCGFLGSGKPTDGIDRCCRAHDHCYGKSNCLSYLEYFVPYLWKCYNGRPLCAAENGEWGSCAVQLCKCDLSLSSCVRKYRCPQRRAVCRTDQLRMLQNFLMII